MSRIQHCEGPPRRGQGRYCGLPTRNPSGLCTYHRPQPAPVPETADQRTDTPDPRGASASDWPPEPAP